jgi:dihydropteroate synthase
MRAELRAKRDAFLNKIKSRPAVMGILNVTPDSFSDGGRFGAFDAAVAQAKAMVAEGCDIVDIGGESTRPSAVPVPAAEELARVEPVLMELARVLDVPLSIDTYKAAVAAAVVITHNRAERDGTIDIFADMRRFFDHSLALAAKAHIRDEAIVLDPGIGFGKTARQNVEALARIPDLKEYGFPILVGASRKAFLGSLTGDGIEGTLFGTVAVNLAAAAGGAAIFRVHDVAANVAALRVWRAIHGNAGE